MVLNTGSKKTRTLIVWFFSITYMISYVTRINYGAIISEIENSTGFSRTLLSMALTGSFITYGFGQIISGMLGDKFPPAKLICCGFLITSLINFLIPLCNTPQQMTILWSVNGFSQSLMWPPLVRLMTSLLSADEYKKATVVVSWGSSFGTILVYLISPLLISITGWKSVFISSASLGVILCAIWFFFPNISNKDITTDKKDSQSKGSVFRVLSPVMYGIFVAIILQGMLRDGVTTWMPSYIADTYNLGTGISILTGVILPIFSIFCFNLASFVYRKFITNPVLCAAAFFGFGTLSAIVLMFSTGNSAILSVLFSAILTGSMHSVNLLLICMIPPFFSKTGKVSTISGIINSCTYIGSAISTYGIAVISQHFGWSITLLTWTAIAALGTIFCLVCAKPWKNKIQDNTNF